MKPLPTMRKMTIASYALCYIVCAPVRIRPTQSSWNISGYVQSRHLTSLNALIIQPDIPLYDFPSHAAPYDRCRMRMKNGRYLGLGARCSSPTLGTSAGDWLRDLNPTLSFLMYGFGGWAKTPGLEWSESVKVW